MRRVLFVFITVLLFGTLRAQPTAYPLNLTVLKGKVQSLSVSADGEHLLLETADDERHYFYHYQLSGNIWSTPELVLSGEKIFTPSFSYDCQRVYFAADFGQGNTDLYYIERLADGSWSQPKALDEFNTQANELSPSIDPFDLRIFFIRNTEPDEPCGQIYYSRKSNGIWQKPIPLIIPGLGNCVHDLSILYDGKVLLYSAKGDDAKSFDLFYTRAITEGVWYTPKLIAGSEPKLNDVSPALDYRNNRLVFVRYKSRFKDPAPYFLAMDNSYKPSPVLILQGKVSNKLTGKPLKVHVDVLNPTTNSPINSFSSLLDGSYRLYLKPEQSYIVRFWDKGLSTAFYSLAASHLNETKQVEHNVALFDTAYLQLNVFDSAIFEPLDVQISVFDQASGQQLDLPVKLLDKGRYVVSLPIGRGYKFKFENEFYRTGFLDFDLSSTIIYSRFERDIELVPLKKRLSILVINLRTGKGISTEVDITNLSNPKHLKTVVNTDNQGKVTVFLRKGDKYEINISPKGYTFYHTVIDLGLDTVEQVVAKLEPLTQETKIEFHNITFETNSAELNEDSYKELDQLVELMKKNPNIKVEISAHTDDVGSEAYNMKLSLRRAQAVVNYLKEHGIPEDRMIAKGYGETRPLVPNDSEEHRAMNRRVELRILEVKNE